jgi:hypothetical protein
VQASCLPSEESGAGVPPAFSSLPSASPDPTGRVHINATQYFGGIPADVWNFRVGGYQVCEKWLKDRKGRTLDYADIQHYQKIVVALIETMRLMAAIDQTIETHSGWPGAFGVKGKQLEFT